MKKSNVEFLQYDLAFCHKLADERAYGAVRVLVDALTETWFNTGRHRRHLNPFPLNLCDTEKWGLTRFQKFRALKFLARVKLIAVDRRDPQEPWIILTWVDRYPREKPQK